MIKYDVLIKFASDITTTISGAVFACGFFLGIFVRAIIKRHYSKTELASDTAHNIRDFLISISAPVIMLTVVVTGRALSVKLLGDNIIFQIASAFALLWASTAAIDRIIKGKLIKLILIIPTLAFIVLYVSDLSKPVTEALNSVSIHIGDVNLSLLSAIKSAFIIILFFWIARRIGDFTEYLVSKNAGLAANDQAMLTKMINFALYSIIFLMLLNTIGINLSSLTVLGGALSVGIGFGLQRIAANFVSGIILIFEKSVKINDVIELEDGTLGFVRKQSARYTLVETFEAKEILIPNEELITNRVTNWTFTNSQGRISADIGVSYDSDLKLVQRLIIESAKEFSKTLKFPEPQCFLTEFGDSSVNFKLYFWISDIKTGFMAPKSEVMFKIWKKFKENNIEIPFPQTDVHIKTKIDAEENDA